MVFDEIVFVAATDAELIGNPDLPEQCGTGMYALVQQVADTESTDECADVQPEPVHLTPPAEIGRSIRTIATANIRSSEWSRLNTAG
jgi:hypothetical protein